MYSIGLYMTVICNYIVAIFVYPCLLYAHPPTYTATHHPVNLNLLTSCQLAYCI